MVFCVFFLFFPLLFFFFFLGGGGGSFSVGALDLDLLGDYITPSSPRLRARGGFVWLY